MRSSGTTMLLILLVIATSSLGADGVIQSDYRLPDGGIVLQHTAIIDAPVREVWRVFSTSEGLMEALVPLARIDLRIGGIWESSYRPGGRIGDPGNIQNEILAFLPERMLTIRIRRTPPGFPHPGIATSVWTVILLDPLEADRTLVTISMLPWQDMEEAGTVRQIFSHGNALTLERLRQRFVSGPLDWNELMKAPEPEPSGAVDP